MNKHKYYILDLDGCISNDRWRLDDIDYRVSDLGERYETYHSGMRKDHVDEEHLRYIKNTHPDARALIITTRPEMWRATTMSWLEKQLPHAIRWSASDLLMRPNGNTQSSPDLKLELLLDWCEAYGVDTDDIVAAYDDRLDVLEMYRGGGIKAIQMVAGCEGVIERTAPSFTPRDVSPAEILKEAVKTFEDRVTVYDEVAPPYKRFGRMMMGMYPDGLTCETEEDFVRLGIFVQCASKLLRYSGVEGGHRDSALDLSVYAAMLCAETDK